MLSKGLQNYTNLQHKFLHMGSTPPLYTMCKNSSDLAEDGFPKEGSIFSHHARHSTSCSSEYRTLSTKSSTDLVLLMPASALNYRVYQVLLQFTISKRTCLLLSLRLSSFSQLLPGLLNIIGACWCWPIDRLIILWKNPVSWYREQTSQFSAQYPPFQYIPWPAESKAALLPCHSPHYWMSLGSTWTEAWYQISFILGNKPTVDREHRTRHTAP